VAQNTHADTPPRETLATQVVLEHPHVAFHLCTCGLHRGAAAVAATLIGYDDAEAIMDYFVYTNVRLHWIAAPTLIPLFSASSGNDP
jgi:hypothetical protein